jgi:hypothetical protein
MSTEGSNRLLPGASALVSRCVGEVVSLVRGAAFWIATLLPFSYIPLLGSATVSFTGFTKLLVLNVVALFVGHGYRNDDGDEEPVD